MVWDLAVGRTGENSEEGVDDEESGFPRGPRVTPGTYEAQLTVDGKVLRQPLKVAMDPRAVATSAELEQQYRLGREMFPEAIRARETLAEIRSVQSRLNAAGGKLTAQQPDIRVRLTEVHEAIQKLLAGSGTHEGDDMGLDGASAGISAALRVVESGDRTVPAQATTLFEESERALRLGTSEWEQLKSSQLSQLNEQLKRANLEPVSIGEHGTK